MNRSPVSAFLIRFELDELLGLEAIVLPVPDIDDDFILVVLFVILLMLGAGSFSIDDSVKRLQTGGTNAWDTARYLNIWVCTLAGGLLEYSQFPGGPLQTDGVVLLNTTVGVTSSPPFNKGRTGVHSIGHYMGLHHIWGDVAGCTGTDFVTDTPNAKLPNTGKPTFPHITCGNEPHGDMFMNFMDYVDDAAMLMFTKGQVVRMHQTLAGPRASLATRDEKTDAE